MPKIIQSSKFIRKSMDMKDRQLTKDVYTGPNNLSIRHKTFKFSSIENNGNSQEQSSGKKPGSSVERKKPIFVFPKISTMKIPGTANIPSIHEYSKESNNNNNHNFAYSCNSYKRVKSLTNNIINNNNNEYDNGNANYNDFGEIEEVANKLETTNQESIIKGIVNYNNNVNVDNNSKNNNNSNYASYYNNAEIDFNRYKDISVNFLVNNIELKEMFEEMFNKNDINIKRKWIDKNLFNKEVFKIRLETYKNSKKDIPSFIKNEINKILSNQYLDFKFAVSYNKLQANCDEQIKKVQTMKFIN